MSGSAGGDAAYISSVGEGPCAVLFLLLRLTAGPRRVEIGTSTTGPYRKFFAASAVAFLLVPCLSEMRTGEAEPRLGVGPPTPKPATSSSRPGAGGAARRSGAGPRACVPLGAARRFSMTSRRRQLAAAVGQVVHGHLSVLPAGSLPLRRQVLERASPRRRGPPSLRYREVGRWAQKEEGREGEQSRAALQRSRRGLRGEAVVREASLLGARVRHPRLLPPGRNSKAAPERWRRAERRHRAGCGAALRPPDGRRARADPSGSAAGLLRRAAQPLRGRPPPGRDPRVRVLRDGRPAAVRAGTPWRGCAEGCAGVTRWENVSFPSALCQSRPV